MRLKVLIFPIAIIIAVALGIGQIWPGVTDIQSNRKKISDYNNVLNSYQQNKGNIVTLTGQINQNKSVDDFIFGYLPFEIKEEELINSINEISKDSSLSSLEISVSGKEEVAASPVVDSLANAPMMGNLTTTSGQNSTLELAQVAIPKIIVQKTGVSVSAVGKYEDVLKFLKGINSLRRAGRFEGAKIEHYDSKEDACDSTETEKKVEDILKMELKIEFAYAKSVSLGGNYAVDVFSKPSLDLVGIKDQMGRMNKFYQLESGASGNAANPFMPL